MTKDKSEETGRVLLGEVGPAHGIRGDVVIRTYTANPEDIASYGGLESEDGKRTFEIRPVRVTQKGLVARIAGANDRTAAEKLRGTKLYVSRDRLPEPEANAFYHSDLIGLTATDRAGTPLGRIVGVHNFGAGDILEVKFDASQVIEFLPFNGEIFPDVDLNLKTIVLVMPSMIEVADETAPNHEQEN